MIKKFKEWYYKYGVLICGGMDERKVAVHTIFKYDAEIMSNKNIMRKIIMKYLVPPLYKCIASDEGIYVFRAKNCSVATQIAKEFLNETDGYFC